MAYEQVGPGYSSGVVPDYASHLGADQAAYANQFQQFTNPFLNAQGVQSEVLPWQRMALEQKQQASQQSYQQGMLGIENARQKMAQTAQDTLLPLQANYLGAQTNDMTAEVAKSNFFLDQQKTGTGQVSDFANAVSAAKSPSDLNAVAGNFPNALATSQGQDIFNHAFRNLDQVSKIRNAAVAQSGTMMGADDASKNPNMTASDYADSLTQKPGESDEDFEMRKLTQPTGFAQKQTQIQGIQAQATNQRVLATLRQQGVVKAAELRTLGQSLRNGTMTPDQLESMSPGLSDAAWNNPDSDFKPDPNLPAVAAPSIYTEAVQKETLAQWGALNKPGANATPQRIAQANAMLTAVLPSAARAAGVDKQVDPATITQLQTIAMQMKGPQSIIQQAASNPELMKPPTNFFGTPTGEPAPYDAAVKTLGTLQQQQQAILKGTAQPSGQAQGTTNAAQTPSTFGNRFFDQNPSPSGLDIGGGMSIPDTSGTQITQDAVQGQSVTIPANPATTAALNQQIKAKPVAATSKKQAATPSPDDIAYLAQNRSPATVQRFDATFGQGSAMKALQAYSSTTKGAPAVPAQ